MICFVFCYPPAGGAPFLNPRLRFAPMLSIPSLGLFPMTKVFSNIINHQATPPPHLEKKNHHQGPI